MGTSLTTWHVGHSTRSALRGWMTSSLQLEQTSWRLLGSEGGAELTCWHRWQRTLEAPEGYISRVWQPPQTRCPCAMGMGMGRPDMLSSRWLGGVKSGGEGAAGRQ